LTANGFPLYYYNSKKFGELDFLIQNGKAPTIIEVKSGKDYRKHAAMNRVLAVENWQFQDKIVFCEGNVEQDGDILYLPWYMAIFILPHKTEYIFPELNLDFDLE